jgi:hypothetical protein
MQDWSKYIERPIVKVLPELEAEGYRVTSVSSSDSGTSTLKRAMWLLR